MKKGLIILVILILLAAFGIGAYILFSKSPEGSPDEESDGGGFFGDFFPFGDSDREQTEANRPSSSGSQNTGSSAINGLQLTQLTQESVSPYRPTSTDAGVLLRYFEQGNGNLYEIRADGTGKTRLSNTTFPGVENVVWSIENVVWNTDADRFVLQYVNDSGVVKSYLGSLEQSTSSTSNNAAGRITGSFLQDDIVNIFTNPSKDTFAYTLPDGLAVEGYTFAFDGDSEELLFRSDFGEWAFEWVTEDTIMATTKPSYIADGYLYQIDTQNGAFRKVFGSPKGLTTKTSTSSNVILYSYFENERPLLYAFDLEDGRRLSLELATISDKCAFHPTVSDIAYCGVPRLITPADYPDMWYQGVVPFNDRIYEINIQEQTYTELIDPQAAIGQPVDLINPQITADGEYLLFINKKDSTLWSLTLPRIIEEEPVATTTEPTS